MKAAGIANLGTANWVKAFTRLCEVDPTQLATYDSQSGESAGTPAPWSIRERVSTMGGQLVVRHRGGRGVRLEVRLPPLVVPA